MGKKKKEGGGRRVEDWEKETGVKRGRERERQGEKRGGEIAGKSRVELRTK